MHFDPHTIQGSLSGPRLLMTAGVHGDEYEPILAARKLIGLIDDQALRGSVTIVPCVNPPAFSANSRCGPDGLDLARTCPGDPHGSITQQIAAEISQLIARHDYYIDMHTGGRALRMPALSGYMLHRDPDVRALQHGMCLAFNLPIIWATNASQDGRTLSAARDANVPAVYIEFGGGGGCDPVIIEAYVNGCLNVMRELAMIDRPAPASLVEHIIEDGRDKSGVLQVQHPSPAAGVFVPQAELGKRVTRGMILGTVLDIAGRTKHSIAAAETGVLVALRALPGVQKGDALAALAARPEDNS